MNSGQRVTDSELPRLKRLAGEVAAAESPDIVALEELATLAGEIAKRARDLARQQLLDLVVQGAQMVFPRADEDLRARVAQSSVEDLARLGALLDDAGTARAGFVHADAGLMAARGRGDYAAMAPLAVEADTHKKAFATAGAAFADLVGLAGSLVADVTDVSAAAAPAVVADADGAAPDSGDVPPLDLDVPADSQPERRRIRDLIRQIRPAPDEAA